MPRTDDLSDDERHWAERYRREHAHLAVDDTHVLLTPDDVRRLPEYSTSLPTGTYANKRWVCAAPRYPSGWMMGEYGYPTGDRVPIIWREVLLVD